MKGYAGPLEDPLSPQPMQSGAPQATHHYFGIIKTTAHPEAEQ